MRRTLRILGFTTTVALAAACGGSTHTQTSPKVVVRNGARLVAATADATAHAKTAKATLSVSMHGLPNGRSISIDMDGALAFDGSAADFTMNLASLVPGAPADAKVEMRVVDHVIYMDMGSMFRALEGQLGTMPPALANIKWLKLDLKGMSSSSSPSQYTQYLDYLRGAAKDGVTTVGTETVRGVETTHYRAELDRSRIIAQTEQRLGDVAPETRPLLEKGLEQLRQNHDPIVSNVWIDADGLTRKFEMTMPITTAGFGATMDVGIELHDFGTPVDVQAPPPSEVRDYSALTDLLQSSTS